ncbi:MAG: TRZ/ATZ family hydrolase [Candidatus Methylopumilus sp.]|nr:TRZ/ATZ family hydrolase [Candidatus Methylopumilus sp.]
MAHSTMQNVSAIISTKWICPVRPLNHVLEDHSIVIDDHQIIDIIDTKKVDALYTTNQHYQLHHHIVTPGLINTHTHAAMNLFRGYADDQSLHTWLNESIWPLEKKWVTPDFVYDGTLIACAEMLKSGITTFNEMYFYPQSAAQAISQSGLRANIGLFVMEHPSNYANDADDYLIKGLEARDGWRDEKLITSSIAPHAPYTISNKTFEKILTYANQLNLTIHMHVHETAAEIEESIKEYQLRPIERLNQLGIISPQFMAVHAVHLNEHDLITLAKESASVVHCPSSNLKLGSGLANIDAMHQHHLNVCLGTDGSASNNKLDLLHEMQLASLIAKGLMQNPSIIDARNSLEMATINGAKALGLDDNIGSIEIGKFADITAFNIDSINTLPIYDPISHLVYALSRDAVSHVWINGALQYQEGFLQSIDLKECKDIALRWQLKLKQNI